MTPGVDEEEGEDDGGGDEGEDGEAAEEAEDEGEEVEGGDAEGQEVDMGTTAVIPPLGDPPAVPLPAEGATDEVAATHIPPQSPPMHPAPHIPLSPPTATDPPLTIPPPPERPHTDLPQNAIELINTASGHTEEGTGSLGTDQGMEVVRPEMGGTVKGRGVSGTDDVIISGSGEEGMVVDLPVREGGEAVEVEGRDEGLVMGEMDPWESGLRIIGEEKQALEMEDA